MHTCTSYSYIGQCTARHIVQVYIHGAIVLYLVIYRYTYVAMPITIATL